MSHAGRFLREERRIAAERGQSPPSVEGVANRLIAARALLPEGQKHTAKPPGFDMAGALRRDLEILQSRAIAEAFSGPGPCTAMVRCSCTGHRWPGVSHIKPCCDQPHVDAYPPIERTP